MDIPFTTGHAGLFIWLDLRDRLPEPGWDGEMLLQQAMARHQLMLAPGKGFGASEPGFFRLGLGSEPTQGLMHALNMMQTALEEV